MADDANRSLRVFLCHASSDKPQVQKLYFRLISDGIDAWLDKEKLLPGQNWQIEIPKAVKNSDVVIVCLSSHSINREGFVQTEIKIALDTADEKPAGTIFVIPARLEDCNVPERISHFHWVDLYSDKGYEWLLKALQLRASTIGASFKPGRKAGYFEKIWVEHNVYEDNTRGMRMHIGFGINNHQNMKCRLIVYFEFEDGTKLKDYNSSHRTVDGNVSVSEDFEPRFDDSEYRDFRVFMPYAELHLASGHHELRFSASIYDKTTDAHIAYSDYYYFPYD